MGPALLGAGVARRPRRSGRAPRVAAARRPLRRTARRVDRACVEPDRTSTEWPSAPSRPTSRCRCAQVAPAAAMLGGSDRRQLAARAAGTRMPQRWIGDGAAHAARWSRTRSALRSIASRRRPDPHDETETPLDQTPRSMPACAGWSTSPKPSKHGMALRLKMPAADRAARHRCAGRVRRVAARSGRRIGRDLPHCSTRITTPTAWRFLRAGTPTNNSAEEAVGLVVADPLHARSFATECARAAAPAGSNADVLAARSASMRTPRPATLRTLSMLRARAVDAQQMATALWPATWGYYLANLIGLEGTGLTLEAIAWAREHFIAHVRAFGPLPHVARRPPAVWRAADHAAWRPGGAIADARERWLATTLKTLLDRLWQPAHAGRAAHRPQRRSRRRISRR